MKCIVLLVHLYKHRALAEDIPLGAVEGTRYRQKLPTKHMLTTATKELAFWWAFDLPYILLRRNKFGRMHMAVTP
jgi:hypothetical protein